MTFADDVASQVTVVDSDPFTELPEDIQDIAGRVPAPNLFSRIRASVTDDQSDLVFESTLEQSAMPLWHSVRRNRITASNMGEVYRYV